MSRHILIEEYISEIDDILSTTNNEIDVRSRQKKEGGVKFLQGIRNRLTKLRERTKWMTRVKRTQTAPSGLTKVYSISNELAKFLNVTDNTQLSRVDVTRAICVYCHLKPDDSRDEIKRWSYLNTTKRDLRDPTNRKNILPDKKLSDLLHINEYLDAVAEGRIITKRRNKDTRKKESFVVTEAKLSYATLQSLISRHLITK